MLLPPLHYNPPSPILPHVSADLLFQYAPSSVIAAAQDQQYSGVTNDPASAAVFSATLLEHMLSSLDAPHRPASTIVASYLLVTFADMVPFVPCQPLAVALGAKLGFALAFPIAVIGQTTAGVLAFNAARGVAKSSITQEETAKVFAGARPGALSPEATRRLEEFRRLTSAEEQGDAKVLAALVGLRLAPFFPFSAGNYLLGATTRVPLRLFVVATLIGCLLSNFISVSVGATGGAMLSFDEFHV